jgi:hypothetical protein
MILAVLAVVVLLVAKEAPPQPHQAAGHLLLGCGLRQKTYALTKTLLDFRRLVVSEMEMLNGVVSVRWF